MGLLDRAWLDDHVLEMPARTVVRKTARAGPGLPQHLDRLVEPGIGFGLRDAEARELAGAIALADAGVEPSAGQQVERGGLLGEQEGIVPGQHHHGRAEAHVAGARGQLLELFRGYRARTHIVYCETSARTQQTRNRSRADFVPTAVIERMLERWTVPDLTEAHETTYVVDATPE